jgi:hypothetical protein
VPPRSVGGEHLVLTCRACNNDAGTKIEGHTAEYERWKQLDRRPKTGRVQIGEHSLVVKVWSDENGTTQMDYRTKNARETVAAFEDFIVREHGGQLNTTFALEHMRPPDEYVADVGWLKAAYLTLFAALGHCVAFSPMYDVVRQQMRYPKSRCAEGFYLDGGSDSGRHIALVREPAELEGSYIVQFDELAVILPPPYGRADPYYYIQNRISPDPTNPASLGVTRDMLPFWPRGPVMEQDGSFPWQKVMTLPQQHPGSE